MRLPISLRTIVLNFRKQIFALFVLHLIVSGVRAQQACFFILNDTLAPASAPEGEYEGCVPFSVKARNCSDGAVSYDFNNQGGVFNPAQFFQDSVHTYFQEGTYTIAQFRGPGIPLAFRTIRVFNPASRPEFTWKTCGKKLLIHFTDTLFSRYSFLPSPGSDSLIVTVKDFEFEYPDASGSPYTFQIRGLKPSTCNKESIPATISLYDAPKAPLPVLLEGIGTDTSAYKASISVRADEDFAFQVTNTAGDFSGLLAAGREDNDNSAFQTNLSLTSSPLLQGSLLRSVTRRRCNSGADSVLASPAWTLFWPRCEPENQKITIRWPLLQIPGLVKFQLLRDGQVLAEPGLADGQFADQDGLVCGASYAYRFRTEVSLAGGGLMVFISPEVRASAISNRPPDPVKNPTATVLPSGIRVDAKPAASAIVSRYHLFRKDREGGTFSEVGSGIPSLPVIDSSARPSLQAYCYRISFDDNCGNRSLLSDSICPVFLKVSANAGGAISLEWTPMEGWKGEDLGLARYELIRKVPGLPDKVLNMDRDLTFEQEKQDPDAKRLVFQIKSTPREPGIYPDYSYSNEVEIIQESRFRFPDAFTPNNDGINDDFRCYGSFLKTFQLIIYNAWGNVVFSTDKADEVWDGKIDGQPAQTGNYAYRAIATDESGERMEKSGFFSLLR